MASIKTTRMELLKLKKKAILASKGHKLLKEKRDALISEFFKLIDSLKNAQVEMEEQIQKAYRSLILTIAVSGIDNVGIAADSVNVPPEITFEPRVIMGVRVPVFKFEKIQRKAEERGYSTMLTTVELDKAAKKFEDVLNLLIKLAELKATTVKLAEEIKKTKRKVNSLERVVMPKINSDVRRISMRLEELERESFTRLKMIKSKMPA